MRPLLVLLVSGFGVALFYLLGWLQPVDHGLRDLRFAADHRVPSGQMAFVEIDSASLAHIGVWPWPRRVHADLLTRLLDMGADAVVFDIDFSVASNEEDDAAFEDALVDAGGYATLVGFHQLPGADGAGAETLPLPRFGQHTELAAVNVAADNTGVIRRSPAGLRFGGSLVPSLPVALAGQLPPNASDFLIDYSIDPDLVPRHAVADVLSGAVSEVDLQGRKVVIGASALELRDVMMTPGHGVLPGGLIQILAAESIKAGRAMAPPIPAHTTLLLALVAVVVAALGRRMVTPLGLLSLAVTAIAIEAGAFWLQSSHGFVVDTAAVQLSLLTGTAISIVAEAWLRRRQAQLAAQQRTEALERLAHLALFDEITGTATRQGFLDELETAMPEGGRLCVATVGLDRFERIVGSLGHSIGDRVLEQVARQVRKLDPLAVGRVSGEAFAVLLAGGAESARNFERRLSSALSEPLSVDGHQVIIGCRVGYIVWSADDGPLTPSLLLRRAEQARGAAASVRGSAAISYEPETEERLQASRRMELALHDALASDDIELYFQGQFDLRSGELIGAEALSRWEDSALGPVSPTQFIPLAEDTGMAVTIGARVLRRACEVAARMPHDCRIAVNVSPVQFELDDVPGLVERTLRETGLPAARLDVEITEGLLLAKGDRTLAVLDRLRAIGVGIALDDFGTGFSSLSYLASLPIDKLKIDQSFVRRMTDDDRVQAIVNTILELCSKLRITSVAEGIESPEQAEALRAAGCDIGQGYLFHRPEPAEAFVERAADFLFVAGEVRRRTA